MPKLTLQQQEWAGSPAALNLARCIAIAYARKIAGADYSNRLEDYYSAALGGLVDSALKYDPTLGPSFVAFAQARVAGAVVDYLRWQQHSRCKHRPRTYRMSEVPEQVGFIVEDRGAAELGIEEIEDFEKLIRPVSVRAKTVLRMVLLGSYESHAEVGRALGVSSQCVSQIVHAAYRRLRE